MACMVYGEELSRCFEVVGRCKSRRNNITYIVSYIAGKNGKTGKSGSMDIHAVGASLGKKLDKG